MERGRYRPASALAWECTRWYVATFAWIPGILGVALRWLTLKWLFASTSGPFRILEHVTIEFPSRIAVGRHAGINEGCWLNGRGSISIGDDAILGPRCVIHSANHRFEDRGIAIRLQGYDESPVTIGRDVWLGANVTVLPGVSIGDGAVIGAGAVVTQDIPAMAVAVGVPARVLRYRGAADCADQSS
jgi:acetyltransferase-like isoleucine patch superfamily enzyme